MKDDPELQRQILKYVGSRFDSEPDEVPVFEIAMDLGVDGTGVTDQCKLLHEDDLLRMRESYEHEPGSFLVLGLSRSGHERLREIKEEEQGWIPWRTIEEWGSRSDALRSIVSVLGWIVAVILALIMYFT